MSGMIASVITLQFMGMAVGLGIKFKVHNLYTSSAL
jgi:hypothetical protein